MLRRIVILIAAFAVPLSLAVGPTAQAALAQAASTAVITPASGPAGSHVTGSGANWTPGDHIQAQWGDDNSNLGSPVVVASDGTFRDSFTIPSGATLGSHQVLFWDQEGRYFEVANFDVTSTSPPSSCPAPSVSFTPATGPVGTTFTITGKNWVPGGTVTSTLPYGSPGWFTGYQTPTVDAGGGFSYKETVGIGPHGPTPAGTYTFTYVENYGGCSLSFHQAFTVTPRPKSCPTVLLGLHGMNEGPSTTKTADPKDTVESTFTFFKNSPAAKAHGPNDYILDDVPYPTTGFFELDNPIKMRTIVSDVVDGSFALEAAVEKYTAACHSSAFELVGYSEGAWVVQYWLHFHQSEARSHVKAVQLYGDPNWYEAYGHDVFGFVAAYQGLSRIAGLTFGWFGPPYPNPKHAPYAIHTFCISKDPVCGEGYKDTIAEHAAQFTAAAFCLVTHCPHLNYVKDGYTKRGGKFLADHAF